MTAWHAVPPGWRLERRGQADAELGLTGDWIARETGLRDPAVVRQVLAETAGATRLRFNTRTLGRWDSALIAFLQALHRAASAAGAGRRIELDETGLPEAARRLLALAAESSPAPPAAVSPAADSLLSRTGRRASARWAEAVVVAALVGETVLRGAAALGGRVWTRAADVLVLMREAGASALGIVAICNGLVGETVLRSLAALGGRVWTRAADVLVLMREAGASALGIVAICNGLVGGILAFVGAVQLRRFGAEIYVADLVGIAMAREMAAMMTAIVMAGRTGGAYAAQLASMQGNEEIDALRAFGIPVFDYLVLPRILALVAMMPLLYLYACAVGLLGGLVVGMATLDVSAISYLEETRGAIAGRHFLIGLAKSVAFGALVALAGCHIGLGAGRSAAEVGRAATSAVVAGMIGVIALDAVFAVCADALGI